MSFKKLLGLNTGSKMQTAPKHNGISREITTPVENQTGTLCKNLSPLLFESNPFSYCNIVELTPLFVSTIPLDAPVVPEE